MEVMPVMVLLLALYSAVSTYEKKPNTFETENNHTVKRQRRKRRTYKVNLKAEKLKTIDEFKAQVDLEWNYNGNTEHDSYVEIKRDGGDWALVKYPSNFRKTSLILYLYFSRFDIRVRVGSTNSDVITFSKPSPPFELKLIKISINKADDNKRDFELTWKNPKTLDHPLNINLRNWFKRREHQFVGIDGYTVWENVHSFELKDRPAHSHQVVLAALPARECEFTVTLQNAIGVSNYSIVVAVERPQLPPLLFNLVRISKSESDTGKDNKRNFHFKFHNTQYGNINKLIQVQFESRVGMDNYTKTWGPWRNHTPVDFGPDLENPSIVLPDYPTYELPAIQFRALSIAYVNNSNNFSNIVTVVRPSVPPENLTLVGIASSSKDTEEVNKRDFEFVIDNHFYDINKIIRLRFQYRIYRLANFEKNTAENWQNVDPDVEIDPSELHVRVMITNIMTSDVNDQYLKIEFRAMAIGYVGVSDPGNIVFAEVPGSPRRLNYIYYGIDVECVTKEKCEMEFDFWISRHNGTFKILDYIIQYKSYPGKDKKPNWKTDNVVPEDGLQYKRQYINFDYNKSYRVVARNEFGVSLPSNMLFDSTNRFKTYAINVSYVKYPLSPKAIKVTLFWEAFTNKDIHNYIVQSNLFFERDTQPMRNEVFVPWNVTSAVYKKKIKFMRYENAKHRARGYYLPEFRVTSRRKDKTYVASSATTIIHFSYEEYKDKGDELCGCMPEKKLIIDKKV